MPKAHEPIYKRVLGFRYLFLINGAVFLLFSFAFAREYVRNHEIQKDIDALQSQAESLATRNLQITELSTAFQTQSFIEREARLKLGLKKPGEDVLVIRRDGSTGLAAPLAGLNDDPLDLVGAGDDAVAIANPTRWWYYFFDQGAYRRIANRYGNDSTSD